MPGEAIAEPDHRGGVLQEAAERGMVVRGGGGGLEHLGPKGGVVQDDLDELAEGRGGDGPGGAHNPPKRLDGILGAAGQIVALVDLLRRGLPETRDGELWLTLIGAEDPLDLHDVAVGKGADLGRGTLPHDRWNLAGAVGEDEEEILLTRALLADLDLLGEEGGPDWLAGTEVGDEGLGHAALLLPILRD